MGVSISEVRIVLEACAKSADVAAEEYSPAFMGKLSDSIRWCSESLEGPAIGEQRAEDWMRHHGLTFTFEDLDPLDDGRSLPDHERWEGICDW